jgi:hypothetical protein
VPVAVPYLEHTVIHVRHKECEARDAVHIEHAEIGRGEDDRLPVTRKKEPN